MSISLDFTLGTFTKLPVNFSQLIYPTRHTIPFIFHSYRQIYFLNSPSLYLPKLRFVSCCYCCLRCAGENSWSVISVKYQQTAWWHFNLNFDKLSYFGQKCKHWQGRGSRQVLLLTYISSFTNRVLPWTLSSSHHQAIRPHLPPNILTCTRDFQCFSRPALWLVWSQ